MTGEVRMFTGDDCGRDVAAYALGALDPSEADTFRRHLDSCTVCREELASLRQLVDALGMTTPQARLSRSVRRRVMAAVEADVKAAERAGRSRQERAVRRRGRLVIGGAALALGLAAFVGVELGSSGSHSLNQSTRVHVYSATVGEAEVRVAAGHAELIVKGLQQPRGNRIYEVWLQRGAGGPAPTPALFSVTRTGAGDVDVPGDLRGVTAVLVTEEPAGGTRVPTGAPVIVAPLE